MSGGDNRSNNNNRKSDSTKYRTEYAAIYIYTRTFVENDAFRYYITLVIYRGFFFTYVAHPRVYAIVRRRRVFDTI